MFKKEPWRGHTQLLISDQNFEVPSNWARRDKKHDCCITINIVCTPQGG